MLSMRYIIFLFLLINFTLQAQITRADGYPNNYQINQNSRLNSIAKVLGDLLVTTPYGNVLRASILDSTKVRADGYPNGHSIDSLRRLNTPAQILSDVFISTPEGNALAIKLIGELSSGSGTDDQQLRISNDTIYLDRGGFVVLPASKKVSYCGFPVPFYGDSINDSTYVGWVNISSLTGGSINLMYINGIIDCSDGSMINGVNFLPEINQYSINRDKASLINISEGSVEMISADAKRYVEVRFDEKKVGLRSDSLIQLWSDSLVEILSDSIIMRGDIFVREPLFGSSPNTNSVVKIGNGGKLEYIADENLQLGGAEAAAITDFDTISVNAVSSEYIPLYHLGDTISGSLIWSDSALIVDSTDAKYLVNYTINYSSLTDTSEYEFRAVEDGGSYTGLSILVDYQEKALKPDIISGTIILTGDLFRRQYFKLMVAGNNNTPIGGGIVVYNVQLTATRIE